MSFAMSSINRWSVFALFCLSILSTPQHAAKAADAFAANERLGRGINLGNALEAPKEGDWGDIILEEADFERVAAAGFDSIRLPVRWSAHAEASPPYTIDATFFDRVDWAVENATSRGLAIIINIHHYDAIMDDPYGHMDRFVALWRQIAAHYANASDLVYFEVFNEPHGEIDEDVWNDLLTPAFAAIRETNPVRPVIIGAAPWNDIEGFEALELPDDPMIIGTFHHYKPREFSHQGALWVDGSQDWVGTTWRGTFEDIEEIEERFDVVEAWSKANNVPIFLGEFGSNSIADMQSRVRWTGYIRQAAARRGWSWSYWDLRSRFGAFQPFTKGWTPLLPALVPDTPIELGQR